MKRTVALSALAASSLIVLGLSGCGSTDVVAKVANSSFKAVIEASKDRVSYSDEDGSWVLASPAGDQALFATDFSANGASGMGADMDKPDVEFSFDAAPFLAAGLDPSKLVAPDGVKYEIEEGRFMLHFELGPDKFAADARKSLEATASEIVRTQRQRIGYHEKLDHYGIKLGGGNMLEWAKDLAKNDKDIVWVLEPAPLVAAGVDPAKVAGWAFAKVESKDAKGKSVFEDKFLRPFDLR
jgi:hypothetical protein